MYLSWTLLTRSIRQSQGRLALISGAVAFGVVVILIFASFFNAFGSLFNQGWRNAISLAYDETMNGQGADPKNSVAVSQEFSTLYTIADKNIEVLAVDTRQTEQAPDLAGITWPKPGEYLLSYGAKDLIDRYDQYSAGDRFGDTFLGVLPKSLTAGPDDLLVIAGKELDPQGVTQVDSFTASASGSQASAGMVFRMILLIGLVVLLFPVLLLVSVSATLGSVQREARYAALRLVGATSKQITQILLLEACAGALLGYLIGLGVFTLIHPLLGEITINGSRIWLSMLTVAPWQHLLVVVAVFALVLLSNAWGMRAVRTSPLGVARRQSPPAKPSLWRLLPLAGAAVIMTLVVVVTPENRSSQNTLYFMIGAIVLIMIGLVLASSWIIYLLARLARKRSGSAPTILGSSYISTYSGRTAKAVSGVVLALFAGTFFVTAISDTGAYFADLDRGTVARDTTVTISDINDDEAAYALAAELADKDYVANVDVADEVGLWSVLPCPQAQIYFTVACDKALSGIDTSNGELSPHEVYSVDTMDEIMSEAESFGIDASDVDRSVVVLLKDVNDVDHIRTLLASSMYIKDPIMLRLDLAKGYLPDVAQDDVIVLMTKIVYLSMGITLVLAIVSMMVSSYASLHERRRSLLTLRLSGMRVRELLRMLLVEAAVPLVVIACVATGLGYAAGWVMMYLVSARLSAHFTSNVLLMLVIAVVLTILATLALTPVLRKVSDPAHNRSE